MKNPPLVVAPEAFLPAVTAAPAAACTATGSSCFKVKPSLLEDRERKGQNQDRRIDPEAGKKFLLGCEICEALLQVLNLFSGLNEGPLVGRKLKS